MKPIRLPDLIHVLQNTPRLPMNQPTSESTTAEVAINLFALQSFINELAGGDWHFFKDLVQAFVQDSDRYIETLKQYCQEPDQQDQAHIQRIVHTLKSSSGSMFAVTLSEQCRILELMWSKYDHPQKVAAIEALSREYHRAKFELTHLADR